MPLQFDSPADSARLRQPAAHAKVCAATRAKTEAVTLIQRFGSALNLNIHSFFHMLFLDFEPGEVFDQLVGASIHYRIAIGPNAGRQALTLRTVPAQPEPFASTLLAKQPGFSLHAATCGEANQRDKLGLMGSGLMGSGSICPAD